MATKKAGKKSSSKKSRGARGFAQDRNLSIDKMVKDLQGSRERTSAFMADPVQIAKDYGVRLSKEEEYAIRFVSGVTLAGLIGRFKDKLAFFDNNCGCPGPGPASW